jgi:hypothetical protein
LGLRAFSWFHSKLYFSPTLTPTSGSRMWSTLRTLTTSAMWIVQSSCGQRE